MERLLAAIVVLASTAAAFAHTDVTATEAHDMILSGEIDFVLDVREYSEFCGSNLHIANAANLPLSSAVLQSRHDELPNDARILVVCASGGRSNAAATFLDAEGFAHIYDMAGGMSAWSWERESCDVEPVITLGGSATETEIDWTPTTGTQDYDLLRGLLDNLGATPTGVDLGPTECLSSVSPFTSYTESASPDPGNAYFYLSRQSGGSWGQSSQAEERVAGSSDCEP